MLLCKKEKAPEVVQLLVMKKVALKVVMKMF